jgi:hypothetical protein
MAMDVHSALDNMIEELETETGIDVRVPESQFPSVSFNQADAHLERGQTRIEDRR